MFIKTMVWLNGYDEVDPHAKYINIDWVTVIEPMVKGGLEISLINSHEDDASFYVVPPEHAPAFLEALAKAEGVIDATVKAETTARKNGWDISHITIDDVVGAVRTCLWLGATESPAKMIDYLHTNDDHEVAYWLDENKDRFTEVLHKAGVISPLNIGGIPPLVIMAVKERPGILEVDGLRELQDVPERWFAQEWLKHNADRYEEVRLAALDNETEAQS